MKKLISIILLLLLIVGISLAIIWNLPKDSSKKKQADLKIEASVLFDDFENNEANANNKYIGKILEINGMIAAVELDEQNASVVILQSQDPIAGILCTLEPGEEENLPADPSGKSITIKGLCTGKLMDVVLNKCIIVK